MNENLLESGAKCNKYHMFITSDLWAMTYLGKSGHRRRGVWAYKNVHIISHNTCMKII